MNYEKVSEDHIFKKPKEISVRIFRQSTSTPICPNSKQCNFNRPNTLPGITSAVHCYSGKRGLCAKIFKASPKRSRAFPFTSIKSVDPRMMEPSTSSARLNDRIFVGRPLKICSNLCEPLPSPWGIKSEVRGGFAKHSSKSLSNLNEPQPSPWGINTEVRGGFLGSTKSYVSPNSSSGFSRGFKSSSLPGGSSDKYKDFSTFTTTKYKDLPCGSSTKYKDLTLDLNQANKNSKSTDARNALPRSNRLETWLVKNYTSTNKDRPEKKNPHIDRFVQQSVANKRKDSSK